MKVKAHYRYFHVETTNCVIGNRGNMTEKESNHVTFHAKYLGIIPLQVKVLSKL